MTPSEFEAIVTSLRMAALRDGMVPAPVTETAPAEPLPDETRAVLQVLKAAGYRFAKDPQHGGLLTLPAPDVWLTPACWHLLAPLDAQLKRIHARAQQLGGPHRH